MSPFGDGSDGSQTFDGSSTITLGDGSTLVPAANVYTLARDIYLATSTVNTGVTILGAGFRVFCNGTLTLSGTASINVNGGAGAATTGGAGGGAVTPATVTLGYSTPGSNGSSNSLSNSMGGTGGNDSFGTTGGVATRPVANGGQPRNLIFAIIGRAMNGGNSTTEAIINGGCGGGGTGTEIGGGGGGVLTVAAYALAGGGSISANGGAGFNSGGRQSGGGGGGYVLFVYHDKSAFTGTITANGGPSGGGTATPGAAGTVTQIQG